MADTKDKQSYVMYKDWNALFTSLSKEDAGELIQAISMYQSGVKEVNIPNCALNAIFEMFKSRFEKDDKKYQDTCDNRANAGSKGGQAKSNNAKQSIANLANATTDIANLANDNFAKQSIANLADKDKEHDKDKDIDKDLKENIYSRAGSTACIESDTESVQDEPKGEPYPEQAKKSKKAKETKADKEAIEVIDYLNAKTGSAYKASSKANISVIRARLNDGYTVEDCKKVIDTKAGQWLTNPDMVKYLRPETLFRPSKFEGYLNECRGKPTIRGDSPPISEQAAFNQSISEAIQRQMLEPVENPVTDEMLDALGIK